MDRFYFEMERTDHRRLLLSLATLNWGYIYDRVRRARLALLVSYLLERFNLAARNLIESSVSDSRLFLRRITEWK